MRSLLVVIGDADTKASPSLVALKESRIRVNCLMRLTIDRRIHAPRCFRVMLEKTRYAQRTKKKVVWNLPVLDQHRTSYHRSRDGKSYEQ